jgi:glutamyl-Q tRNA(Asp) synthetase
MRTRFAPSPTGPLHLGHAYSAWAAHDLARAHGGAFLLRIEDIDRQRSKPEWEARLIEDLAWLGIAWDEPPLRQSERMGAYDAALDRLWERGLLYACDCTRRDILDALTAPQEGAGPDGPVYPGTCREKDPNAHERGPRPRGVHLRLNVGRALQPGPHAFREAGTAHAGEIIADRALYDDRIGDVVLARKDFGTSYHLSVVVDDAHQGVTDVVRGVDLFEATPIHVLLQRLLDLPTPVYHHHPLIRDHAGKRLAKRDDARAVALYRSEGWTPEALRAQLEGALTVP